MSQFFLRNQLCIPVKGYNRSIVYDLLRKDYHFIANEHFEILDTDGFIQFWKLEDAEERQELMAFLLKEEIIFELSDPEQGERFIPLDRSLHTPNQFSNLIIHSNLNPAILDLLDQRYLMNISIIVPDLNEELLVLINKIDSLEVDGIYLYVENFNEDLFDQYTALFSSIPLVFSVNFFNTSAIEKTKLIHNIYYNFFEERFEQYKSRLSFDKLDINNEHFFEAYNRHSYYFGKIYIDALGLIKNGLNNKSSFGDVQDFDKQQFSSLLSSAAFQELGLIQKNDTLICKDCEFRYMCMDSRVPTKAGAHWYHEEECRYNPYLSKWDTEPGYQKLTASGLCVSISGVEIDEEKLVREFDKAWSA